MMARHRGGGSDGGYSEGVWLPGGYAGQGDDDQRDSGDALGDPHRATRTSPGQGAHTGPSPDETNPPWEEASPPWDQAAGEWNEAPGHWDQAREPWQAGGHPSGPLPPVRPEQDWPEQGWPAQDWPEPPASGYPGPNYPGPDYPGPEYPGPDYQGPDYPEDGYSGYHVAGAAGYPGDGGGYGGYPGPGYDDDPTYVHPAYPGDRFTGQDAGYADDGGYPAGGGDEYEAYRQPVAGRHGDRDYPDRGWYADVDDDQDWTDEDDDGGADFLPGLSNGAAPAESEPGGGPRGSGRSGPRPRGKRKSRMRRVAQWLALSVVLLLLLGAGAAYYYLNHYYLHPPDYTGSGTGWVTVQIYPGDSAATVGQRLQRAGVVETARAFQNAAKASGQGSALEPGYYRVHTHMAAALAFALLLKPSSRIQTRVTIPEGQRLTQIIAELGHATGNSVGYQQASKDIPALGLPPYANGNPEGYLFPATYDIQPNTPPVKVLKTMVARFGVEAVSVSLPAAAAHAQLTEGQVIVVASLIQAEGRNPADFPKIAEVIYNRLNSGIKLQLDSTVMYALHTYGIRATSAQARVRSSYNTYLHVGLPPGPIDSPGDVAIRAALHPAHGNLMYFVTVDPKTGLTKFTSSFAVAQQYEAELTANLAKGR